MGSKKVKGLLLRLNEIRYVKYVVCGKNSMIASHYHVLQEEQEVKGAEPGFAKCFHMYVPGEAWCLRWAHTWAHTNVSSNTGFLFTNFPNTGDSVNL